jgi:2C-methyl-D-erythritol 2,4-cyclodiphosphate synthase
MVQSSVASDYVVSQSKSGDVVVELKGTDVDHAVKQVEATMQLWESQGYRCGKIAGLVVCTQYPRIDTRIQRMKAHMAKKYGAPLHVQTRNREYDFARVLEFTGPD